MDKFKFLTKNNLEELPKTSGVYFFYYKKNLIYIGKAINIKNRVKNHFFQPSYRDKFFMEKVEKIGFLETNSEIEALILEANLIKKHQPKYNVIWRDDKNYFYVAISQNDQKIPYVFITHQKSYKNTEYIGPFVEGTALKKTLKFLRRVFPYYTAKKHPKTKCTWCHLDLCPGPNPDLVEYKKNIKNLITVLKGKKISVLKNLKTEMKTFSKNNKFEDAAKIRDRIFVLEKILAHTKVFESQNKNLENKNWENTENIFQNILNLEKISRIECYDISNIQGKMATGSMIVFIDGKPEKNQYKKFKINAPAKPNDILMLKEILQRRFAHPEWKFPEVILIDGGKAQLNAAIEIKNNFRIQNIKIMSIAKGRQELFIEGYAEVIPLGNLPQEIYNLVKSLDDEAHRFAITYHKTLRKKNLLK